MRCATYLNTEPESFSNALVLGKNSAQEPGGAILGPCLAIDLGRAETKTVVLVH